MIKFDPKILEAVRSSRETAFSFFDYLGSVSAGPEDALIYSKLFWPEFVEFKDYIILAEMFDQKRVEEIEKEFGEENVEKDFNIQYLQNLVGFGSVDDGAAAVWEALGLSLSEMWKAKAEICFPNRRFVAEFNWYTDIDPGVVVYQSKFK